MFKTMIKKKVAAAAHQYLSEIQKTHSKISGVKYEKLETQSYLTSSYFSDKETKLLAALRSRTHEDFKKNFRNLHSGQ